jgi:hypothetical protein
LPAEEIGDQRRDLRELPLQREVPGVDHVRAVDRAA